MFHSCCCYINLIAVAKLSYDFLAAIYDIQITKEFSIINKSHNLPGEMRT